MLFLSPALNRVYAFPDGVDSRSDRLQTLVSEEFLSWIEKLTEPDEQRRFSSASTALKALKQLAPTPVKRTSRTRIDAGELSIADDSDSSLINNDLTLNQQRLATYGLLALSLFSLIASTALQQSSTDKLIASLGHAEVIPNIVSWFRLLLFTHLMLSVIVNLLRSASTGEPFATVAMPFSLMAFVGAASFPVALELAAILLS